MFFFWFKDGHPLGYPWSIHVISTARFCRFFAYHFMEPGERQNFIRWETSGSKRVQNAPRFLWTTQAPRSLVVWPSRRQCLCLIGMLGLLSWWLGWLQWRCPKYFRSFLEMRRSILLVGPSLGSWPLQRRLCSVSAANDFFLLQRLLIS